MTAAEILVLGEPLAEFAMVETTAADGAGVYRQFVGGDAITTAVAAARQGAGVGFVSAVGADPMGQAVLDRLRAEGIGTEHLIRDTEAPTGVRIRGPHGAEDGAGITDLRKGTAASRYGAEALPRADIARAAVLHVSAMGQSVSATLRSAIEQAVVTAGQGRALVSFDANPDAHGCDLALAQQAMAGVLPRTGILFVSAPKARDLTGAGEREAQARWFLDAGAAAVVIRGPTATVFHSGERFETPDRDGPSPEAAAEVFAGAFLAAYARHRDLRRAADTAAAVASRTVPGAGSAATIPFARDLEALP